MRFATVLDYPPPSTGMQRIFEYPEGVAGEVAADEEVLAPGEGESFPFVVGAFEEGRCAGG